MFHCTHPRPSSDYKSQKEFSFSLLLITPPLSKYQIRYCKPPINQRSWVRCWSRKVLLARKCGVRQRQWALHQWGVKEKDSLLLPLRATLQNVNTKKKKKRNTKRKRKTQVLLPLKSTLLATALSFYILLQKPTQESHWKASTHQSSPSFATPNCTTRLFLQIIFCKF